MLSFYDFCVKLAIIKIIAMKTEFNNEQKFFISRLLVPKLQFGNEVLEDPLPAIASRACSRAFPGWSLGTS